MNTANVLAALQIASLLAERVRDITEQVRAGQESGEGISDDQLAAIRAGVDTSRANLVAAIDSLDAAPDVDVMPSEPTES